MFHLHPVGDAAAVVLRNRLRARISRKGVQPALIDPGRNQAARAAPRLGRLRQEQSRAAARHCQTS